MNESELVEMVIPICMKTSQFIRKELEKLKLDDKQHVAAHVVICKTMAETSQEAFDLTVGKRRKNEVIVNE